MGADYKDQDKGIEELKSLSEEGRKFLSHHLRNSLNTVIGGINTGQFELAKDAAWHMVEDLEKIGC